MPLLGCPCAVAERALGLPVQMKGKGSGGFAMELEDGGVLICLCRRTIK